MKTQSCRKFLFLIPPIVLGFVALLALAVFGLWNGVLTDVLGLKPVTYWQALGILVLAKILFGGFPGPRGAGIGKSMRARMMMMKNWESMTPEQREAMREEMRRRFGDWPRPSCCEGESNQESPDGGTTGPDSGTGGKP